MSVVGGEETAEAISGRYDAASICLELEPVPGPEHAEVARWAPEDPAAIGPATTAIDVTVYELACASGESATGRIAEPEIVYGETEVVVTISVVPRVGLRQFCPGNPATPFTVELAEPLGERTLLDGGQDPPGPPHVDP